MADTRTPRFGWIGLGNMGLAMSKNLQKHLSQNGAPALCYTNRTISRGEPLEALGGTPLTSVAEVVQASDVVFVSISADSVLEGIVTEILESGPISGKIIVDTSTVHPSTSDAASKKIVQAGGLFVAAPVFGATPVAEQGKLLFALGGPSAAIDIIAPYIDGVLARAVIRTGEEAASAATLKTLGNFLTAGMHLIISSAYTVTEKSGMDASVLSSLITENYGPYAASISDRLTSGAYLPPRGAKPISDLELALKDVGHGITCAKDVGVKLDVAELVMELLGEAQSFGAAEQRSLDSTSVYGALRKRAGLEFESDVVKKRDG
ncbi:hypothetical protein BP6252_06451 [Coleophoma cylindrospora]|uniref:6-phosphogluconate dehydrogenase family protein n=1 Tax=Coleophoma cylindrospora TaxID=1849047 RepID=A0A3D8RMN1_9HELO|nr:hypothetical protein BP6252_06451 [Coleophoma cylindrospora]